MKKNNDYPRYEVTTSHGKLGEMNTITQVFNDPDLLTARGAALDWAWAAEKLAEGTFDDPGVLQNRRRKKPITAFWVAVSFVESQTNESLIYGEEIHEVLAGLNAEGDYFMKNKLMKPEGMIKIYQNTDETDQENQYEVGIGLKSLPAFDNHEFDVVPTDLLQILASTQNSYA